MPDKPGTPVAEDGIQDASDTKRQVFMGIVYRTAALVLFTAFLLVYFPGSGVFYPAAYAAAIVYAGLVASLLIAGRMARPLTFAAVVLAAAVFLAMSLPAQDLAPGARGLGMPVLITGIIGALHFLSRAYSEFTGVLTRSLLIAALGVLYYSAFTAIAMPLLSEATLLALIAFTSAAVYSLLGIMKRHSNARIAYVGRLFSRIESPAIVSVAVAAIMTYVVLVRQSLAGLGDFGLAVIEWAALSGVVLFIFVKIQTTVLADSVEKRPEAKADSARSDLATLRSAASEVESFVDGGKKDGLVLLLAKALVNNEIPANAARPVLAVIVDHQDDAGPPILFKWAVGDIEATNRKKRRKAVDEAMAAMESAIGAKSENGRNAAEAKKE